MYRDMIKKKNNQFVTTDKTKTKKKKSKTKHDKLEIFYFIIT